jgi:WD40 repeat protein
MIEQAKCQCPDLTRLDGLLRDRLSASEQAELMEHVGECRACQETMTRLADGPSLSSSGDEISARTPTASLIEGLRDAAALPPSDSAFWPAYEGLEKALTVPALEGRDRTPMPFLAPSEEADYIGLLDQFGIRDVIGRGGMGLVLRGHDTWLNREVAIKVLAPELAEDETAQHRFCREARAAASVDHEHVVSVHHVAEGGPSQVPYLVMQLVDGEGLDERLARVGKLPLADVVRMGAQIAAGLAAAHERGLIHRDIKPGNILLERGTDKVKITDFGLARAAEDVRLTRSGLVTGTPLYMAPEQARGETVDARADLFSFGIVLYEMCTGETPFDARTPLAVLKRLSDEPHRPVRALNPEVPQWLSDVIDRLLAKSPEGRFQTAREVAVLLDHYWAGIKTSSEVTPALAARKPWWLHVGILLAAVAVGSLLTFVAVSLWRGKGPEEPSVPPVAVLRGDAGTVWCVAFSPDGEVLATGIEDGTVKLWDVNRQSLIRSLRPERGAAVWSVEFSANGKSLLTATDNNTAVLWALDKAWNPVELKTRAATRAAHFSRDGKLVYTGDRHGDVRVWGLSEGKELRSWRHSGAVYALALSRDNSTAASAGSDPVIRLWDVDSGTERAPLNGHAGQVYSLDFHPDGKVLASAGWDRIIRLWDVGAAVLSRELKGHQSDIWAVRFSPDGRSLASAGGDGTVRVWDARTGELLQTLRGHEGNVHSLGFSRDGTLIASGGRDGTVRLWNAVSPPE